MPRRPGRAPFAALPVSLAAALLLALTAAPSLVAQVEGRPAAATATDASALAPVTLEHYGAFKRITSAGISPDGRWMTYAFAPNDGTDTLFVRELDGDRLLRLPAGSQPSFSNDSRFVAFRLAPQRSGGGGGSGSAGAAASRGGNQGAAATRAAAGDWASVAQATPSSAVLRIVELSTGATTNFTSVQSFSFSDDARRLVLRMSRADSDADHQGADLVLHDLSGGVTRNIGNVASFAFDPDEALLAYAVDAVGRAGNGVYLMDTETGRVTPLATGDALFTNLSWNDAGDRLAFLQGDTPEGMEQRESVLHIAGELRGAEPTRTTYDPGVDASFPRGFVLSHMGGVRWNDDGTRIFLGIKEQREEGPTERSNSTADVDVWHWADEQPQSVQARRANQARQATWTASFNLDSGRLVRLADEQLASVSTNSAGRWAIGRDTRPYAHIPQWGGSIADTYRVDMDTGERTLIEPELVRQMGTSPDGRWFLYFKNETIHAHDLETGRTVNLSERAPVSFANEQHSHPNETSNYGVAGWTTEGDAVVLNHRYDLWLMPVANEGEAVNLTRGVGTEREIVFRVIREDGPRIDLAEPLFLSAFGDRTKHSGYWSLEVGSEPRPILYEDMRIGRPIRADSTDRAIFTKETFTMFPDYWVSDGSLQGARRVTDANPQLAELAWSPGRVLIDYTNERGHELQGTLALPAGYEPGRRYPMLVYFYETMSQQHHNFQMPRYDDRPHVATYASNGYLVLQPDIVYTMGQPGSSALDDLTSAVQRVIDLGYADPERIGLQGHSWGGYQSSFVLTQTDIFAAVVTGAPVTNLVSFYNELYASSGSVQQGITEAGQVRMGMGVTPWNSGELYRSQSPVHNVENINTPFLILHGTDDGAVDWRQGLEFFNSARRNGKEVILLSYPGEAHHLGRRANQEDFQVRMRQFFDHHLLGSPAPGWMTEGVPFIDKFRVGPGEVTTVEQGH